ncbi:hypothetical protein L0657_09185 [Dyadobacter sp. CY345]|uniref:hypothetical protein n=1 Tax=Dyadobacter sp. CY345 TaxID=2909335 RepID=UPI001F1E2B35|nr:hypothetical protein [Dyadobacter sp. CY345]MCF2444129.1 hypothetical protein [Dyadobacter sp. CY345]
MNYFDIFRIDYDDLAIIASKPEAIITSVEKINEGYIGKIILLGEYTERESNVLFVHENEFPSVEEAYSDLDQIIETIKIAFENTKRSEAKNNNYLSEW